MTKKTSFVLCTQDGCTRKIDCLFMFCYECPGCKKHFCHVHLDSKFGHSCPERVHLHSIKLEQLEKSLPRVVAKKIQKI